MHRLLKMMSSPFNPLLCLRRAKVPCSVVGSCPSAFRISEGCKPFWNPRAAPRWISRARARKANALAFSGWREEVARHVLPHILTADWTRVAERAAIGDLLALGTIRGQRPGRNAVPAFGDIGLKFNHRPRSRRHDVEMLGAGQALRCVDAQDVAI